MVRYRRIDQGPISKCHIQLRSKVKYIPCFGPWTTYFTVIAIAYHNNGIVCTSPATIFCHIHHLSDDRHQYVYICLDGRMDYIHDDVIKWKHFPHNWPFVRGIHRCSVNSPHKGQWRGALMFSLICLWINDWVSNREAGDLRRYRAIMTSLLCIIAGSYGMQIRPDIMNTIIYVARPTCTGWAVVKCLRPNCLIPDFSVSNCNSKVYQANSIRYLTFPIIIKSLTVFQCLG